MYEFVSAFCLAICSIAGMVFLVYLLCSWVIKTLDRIATTKECTATVVEVLQWMQLRRDGTLRGNRTPLFEIERVERKLFAIKQYHLEWDWHEPGIECKICRTLECTESGSCSEQCLICNKNQKPVSEPTNEPSDS